MLPLFVILGAGRSAGWLIDQMSLRASAGEIRLKVIDGQYPAFVLSPSVEFTQVAISDEFDFTPLLRDTFCVVSLLPPFLHPLVMEACLRVQAHFVSASYESPAARSHNEEAKSKGLLILNECGLDPGLDHVTAMAMLDRVKSWGGRILSFESDCGGLPSRRDLNDWGYRFFWNPMNVVTAGAAGARFMKEGISRLIAYPEVFKQHRPVFTEEERALVAYPNRDSIPYQHLYGLDAIPTYIRGTIRYEDFCERWALLAEANAANSAILLEADMLHSQWLSLFRWHTKAYELLSELLDEAGLADEKIGKASTSADVLLFVLTRCWNNNGPYTDRVLMRHRIVYQLDGKEYSYTGTLDIEGTKGHSAMAFTVGLPIAIVTSQLQNTHLTGALTPIDASIWPIIYKNLPSYNIEMAYENLPLP